MSISNTAFRLFPVAFLLLFTTNCALASLSPHNEAPRYAHLFEVNKRWVHEAAPTDFLEKVLYVNEAERIADHLLSVAAILEKRDVTSLSNLQIHNRAHAIALLRAYAKTGKFPFNAHHDTRTPYFVDELETHCAVGHLMQKTGLAEAVKTIRTETNYGYVLEELSTYFVISQWGEAHGFTNEELAWIQPGYSSLSFGARAFGNNLGVSGGDIFAGVSDQTGVYLGGSFSEVDGTPAGGLAYLQQDQVEEVSQPYPSIKALYYDTLNRLLYAHGVNADVSEAAVFTIDDSRQFSSLPLSLAPTDSILFEETLEGVAILQQGMDSIAYLYHHTLVDGVEPIVDGMAWQGIIFDIKCWGDSLAVGGNYVVYENGSPVDSNCAYISLSVDTLLTDLDGYEVYRGNFQFDTIPGSPVILKFPNNQPTNYTNFYLIATSSGDSIVPYAYQNGIFSYSEFDPLSITQKPWKFPTILYRATTNDESSLLISGDQKPEPWFRDSTRSVIAWRSSASFVKEDVHCNGYIKAMAKIGDTLLLIGNFSELSGQPINDLGWTDSQIVSSSEEPLSKNDYRCYNTGKGLVVEFTEARSSSATLHLYSIEGRYLRQYTLATGQTEFRFPMVDQKLSSYVIQTTDGIAAGILVQ